MHKDQGQVRSAVQSFSWSKLIHQPLLLDYPEEGGVFLIDWLIGWLFFSQALKNLSWECPVISQFRSGSCCFWDAPLAHKLGLKSGLSLYFSLTEVSL